MNNSVTRLFTMLLCTGLMLMAIITSIFPEPSSANPADELGWSATDGLVEGGELIISTDGTHSFGALGPTMLYRQTLAGETAGTPLSTNVPYGRGTVTAASEGAPKVASVPELPYGKGIEIGTGATAGRVYVVDTQLHEEFYEHYYLYFPAAHQDNALGDLTASVLNAWQIKGIWHYETAVGYTDPTLNALYAHMPLWTEGPDYYTPGAKIGSAAAPTSTFARTASGIRDPNNIQRWRAVPLVRQLWVKSGPVPGTAEGSDGLYRLTDTAQGVIESTRYTGTGYWTRILGNTVGFDRFSMPGFVRGYDISKNQHVYFADIYQAVGPGAAARIEITDNANYAASKKITILDVQSWTDDEVRATIRKGIFSQESLVGKHIHLHDANNTPLYIGQLNSTANASNNSVSVSANPVATGSSTILTATGDRQAAAGVIIGDERYIPTSWTSTEASQTGTFALNGSSYESTYIPAIAGTHTVTAVFRKDRWNGAAWADSGTTANKTTTLTVTGSSGGNSQLGWNATSGLVEGGELILSTDGTYSFGAVGPTMLYRQTLSQESTGTALSTSVPVGRGTVVVGGSGSPKVAAVPELPYGKGIVVGTVPASSLYVQDIGTHTEFYEHYYLYWPAAHQDNSLSDLLATTTSWKIKGMTHSLSGIGNSVYANIPSWFVSGDYFTPGDKIGSSGAPISTFDRSHSGIRDPLNTQRWRAVPMVRQLWVKSGATAGSATGSDGMYRLTDTSQGQIQSTSYTNSGYWSYTGASTIGFDRFTLPDNVQGFDISKNQHAFIADIYQAVGPGAAARIEITDNATYSASKEITILDVQSWADDEVNVMIRKGIFSQVSLVGKHLHLFDADNNHIYIGQL